MKSLALGSLKMSPREVQYLPQLINPHGHQHSTLNLSKDISVKKLDTSRSR